jgi:non-homologous end joining protein Ku
LSGCSGLKASSQLKISEGDKVVKEVKNSNASANAPSELRAAEDKLGQAKAAFDRKDYGDAYTLAEQALVDADYARAKGSTEKVKKEAEALSQNIRTLRQEIEVLSKKTSQGGK